jgi:hypothetical protein
MILGNHFAHKASQATADVLSAAFPGTQFAMLGEENAVRGNVRSYKAGILSEDQIRSLYDQANVVVLPSYIEGFGLGIVHALAARKIIVARDIPATREILATYRSVSGVFLYQDEPGLIAAMTGATSLSHSAVDDSNAHGWDDWADGFADLCRRITTAEDVFPRLVERIGACDLLERAARSVKAGVARSKRPAPCRSLRELMSLDGEEFVWAAYATIFARHPDTEGLRHYVSELESGVAKFALISRLRDSDEGRSKNLPLAGFRRAALVRRMRALGER